MRVAIQFSKKEELKALPILLRHSPGMALEIGFTLSPRKLSVLCAERA